MEIALLPKNAVRIKGKQALLVVNPSDSGASYHAALFLDHSSATPTECVAIAGPGEYEVSGVKISGTKSAAGVAYSISVDDVDVLVGSLSVVEKLQHKLKEHHLALLHADTETDASFVTSHATSGVLVYGEKAKENIQKFAKEGMQEMNKFQTTKDKLPQEVQTILLQ